jgi:hypothetical protein
MIKIRMERIMKKIALLIAIIALFISGCGKETLKDNFKLTYSLSNTKPKLGDEIEIKAVLQNISKLDYSLAAGFPLIEIYVFKPVTTTGGPDEVVGGVGKFYIIKSLQSESESKKFVFDKVGKYIISISSRIRDTEATKFEIISFELKPIAITIAK